MKVDNIKLQEIVTSSGFDGKHAVLSVHVFALWDAIGMKSRSPEKSFGVADMKVLKLDEEVATLHFLAINVEVTFLPPKQASSTGVKVQTPQEPTLPFSESADYRGCPTVRVVNVPLVFQRQIQPSEQYRRQWVVTPHLKRSFDHWESVDVTNVQVLSLTVCATWMPKVNPVIGETRRFKNEMDLAGPEGLYAMKVDNIKPRDIVSCSCLDVGCVTEFLPS